MWIESLIVHADTLVLHGKVEEAIQTLKKICYILPPLPIPKLSFITKELKSNLEVGTVGMNEKGEEVQIETYNDDLDLSQNMLQDCMRESIAPASVSNNSKGFNFSNPS